MTPPNVSWITDNVLPWLLCLVGAGLPAIWRGFDVAAKKAGATSDADWLLGAWQMAGELSREMGLAVQISLTPTNRKGVWRVLVRVLHTADNRPVGIVVQAKGEYPNSAAQSFPAYLSLLMHEADKLLAEEINAERLKLP